MSNGSTTPSASIDHLVHRISALVEAGEVQEVARDEGAMRWTLLLGDGSRVEVHHRLEPGLLVLNAGIGTPEPSRRPQVLETLLLYSSLRASTGTSMAVAEPGGECEMFAELSMARLDACVLAQEIRRFSDMARRWRAIVRDSVGEPPATRAATARSHAQLSDSRNCGIQDVTYPP